MVEFYWSGISGVILFIIVILGVFALWRLSKELRSGYPLRDERSKKITGRAATYAFYTGSYFMIALMLANILNLEFREAPILDTGYALATSVLVQSLIFIVSSIYFKSKGD